MGTARQFSSDLSRFADQIEGGMAVFRRRVILGLKEKVERKTPVDTGRLRASWAASDSTPSTYAPSKGASGLGPIEGSFSEAFDISYLVSNLPYAAVIEFGGSKQAPQGMVRVSLAELETELEATFGEL
tara:strand:+ start:693 stop:1079 length:387 start_codon:yes stop_codon:yes gene_type:complete